MNFCELFLMLLVPEMLEYVKNETLPPGEKGKSALGECVIRYPNTGTSSWLTGTIGAFTLPSETMDVAGTMTLVVSEPGLIFRH
ncbi:Hypothetical protein NTJ_11892 [Nesidiocoris tenuis]|uniref:Uncharacterized protein n=1 Tax=Nesidiocoris tenuis TaxID=355587 RepID=A0ABN7B7E3_9HEMI|nr:Hypothetical protein NTJ_11892 [Nesidiocoris tenuis]